MKNVIKGFAVAAFALSIVACKNETSSNNSASISAPATAPAEQAATTAAAAPTVPATVEKVVPNAAQTTSAKPAVKEAPAPAVVPATTSGKTTGMKFDEMSYDWGTVKEGEKMTHIFKFKNTGSNDLIISDARGSCGCTVPEWPKEPIKPGKTGEMKVVFDSSGKPGDQQKTVTVTANTEPANMMVVIKGKVSPKEGATN